MNYDRYKIWFYAAAMYNFVWGVVVGLFPRLYFDLIEMEPPRYLALWQVIGMFVLVYAPAYFWVARYPDRYPHLILIGLLGKILGPLGFVFALSTNQLPLIFGLTLLTNDLIWWPIFMHYIYSIGNDKGWKQLIMG